MRATNNETNEHRQSPAVPEVTTTTRPPDLITRPTPPITPPSPHEPAPVAAARTARKFRGWNHNQRCTLEDE
jgi:hypothetical protein